MLIMLALVACGGTDTAQAENTGTSQQDAAPTTVNNPDTATTQPTTPPENNGSDDTSQTGEGDVVAQVNGVPIYRATLEREFERYQQNTTVTDARALRAQVLETLIEQEVIAQAAAELGVTVDDAAVDEEIQGLKNAAGSDEAWQAFLQQNGYTEAEMREAQRDSLLTRRVRDALLTDYSGLVEQVKARHILVRTEDTAQQVLTRLNEGAGFAELALEYSIDSTSNSSGGDLGWFTREELTDDALADVAFNLEPGQIAGPVRTSLGYHILQTVEKEQRPIEQERLPLLAETIFNRWLFDRMQAADIERNL
jgi:parvulin-like peptidyl-prolyl isomerase